MTPRANNRPDPVTLLDAAGRTWPIELTVGSVARIRDAHGLDLAAAIRTPQGMADLVIASVDVVAAALWEIVHVKAKSRGVDERAFLSALDGSALERGLQCLALAAAHLYPLGKRAKLLMENIRAYFDAVDERLAQQTRAAGPWFQIADQSAESTV